MVLDGTGREVDGRRSQEEEVTVGLTQGRHVAGGTGVDGSPSSGSREPKGSGTRGTVGIRKDRGTETVGGRCTLNVKISPGARERRS